MKAKMGRFNENKAHWGKRWIWAFGVMLLLMVLFWQTESAMKEENDSIYQVYCLGDSITYGSGLPKEIRSEACYPGRLQQLLGMHYQVMNYGVSGRTLMENTERAYRDTGYVDMVKLQNPDVIFLMLGTNDSKLGVWDSVQYHKEYVALVKELQTIAGQPDIYLMIPPEAFPGEDGVIVYGIRNDVIRDEMRDIVRIVAEETGAELIDLYAVTEDHPEYFMDGVHPNQQGYEVLADAVYRQFMLRSGVMID